MSPGCSDGIISLEEDAGYQQSNGDFHGARRRLISYTFFFAHTRADVSLFCCFCLCHIVNFVSLVQRLAALTFLQGSFSSAFRDGRAVRCRCRQGPPRALARDGTGQKERGDGIWTVQQQTPIETCVLRVPYAKRVWRTGRFLLLLERTLAVFPSSHLSCLACLLA